MVHRTTRICVALLLATAALTAHVARAAGTVLGPDAPAYKELGGVYGRVIAATRRRDAESIIAWETSDFTCKHRSGKVLNKAEFDAALRRGMRAIKEVKSFDLGFNEVRQDGDNFNVTATQRLIAIIVDAQGKEHEYVEIMRALDVWQKPGGDWKVRYTQQQATSITIDGRRVE